jgi:DNA-directed RNA polymerase alpha subunit
MKPLVCPHCKAELEVELSLSARLRPAPDEPPWRRIPLEELELSVRAHNCLHNMGRDTAGEVDDATDNELLCWPNLGRRSLREIREVLSRLKAKQEPPK